MTEEENRFWVGDAESTLDLEEYLSMHRALANQTRYEIVWLLVEAGEMSLEAIKQELAVDDEGRLEDHVETLLCASLVERWEQTDRGSTETSTTFRPTVFAWVALTDGIHELIRSEREFSDMYSSDDKDEG